MIGSSFVALAERGMFGYTSLTATVLGVTSAVCAIAFTRDLRNGIRVTSAGNGPLIKGLPCAGRTGTEDRINCSLVWTLLRRVCANAPEAINMGERSVIRQTCVSL